MTDASSLARVERFVASARPLAQASAPVRQRAAELLRESTGLSDAGVAYALDHCLEVAATPADLERLCASVTPAEKAHVSLAANVFTAPLRAIALALAASGRVAVRPSRREPVFTRLLHELSGGMFELVETLDVRAKEHVFAYGSDETLDQLARSLPRGVLFSAHGAGLGVAVVDEAALETEADLARRLARDTVAFDQRGCLSPRLVLVDASAPRARAFAREVHHELARLETSVPRGNLLEGERADLTRYRAMMLYLGELYEAEASMVVFDAEARQLPIPPTGRNLCVVCTRSPAEFIAPVGSAIAALGLACRAELEARVRERLPKARVSAVGRMQRPKLDGPVDLRAEARVL